MSQFLLFRNYIYLYLLLFVILIVNISLILNIPIQSFAFPSNSSRNESGTLADEKQEDLDKKKLAIGLPIILNGFNNPSILSSMEQKKIESIIDQTYISPEIPITNYTIILPDPDKEIALVKNKTVGDFEKTKDIFSNISKISAKSSSDTIKSKDIFKFTPSELKKNDISFAAEPSIATNGKIFLFTGNHFAAISKDGANNWKYFNLTEVMPDFCCDQDVIYDTKHKLFLWYIQGATSCSNNENRSIIGISRDGSTWRFIEIKPTDLNKDWKNMWFDYPTIALSENFAYLTTNVVKGFQCLKFITKPLKDFSVIFRIPLDELSNSIINTSNSLHFDSYYQKSTNNRFTFTPVQGATNTMYWATHLGNTEIRIYNWTEAFDSNSVKYKDVTIKFPWVPIKKGSLSCPLDNQTSGKWCNKADSRIQGGWISDKIIGFLWNAAAGKETEYNFTTIRSYVDGAIFNTTNDMKYEGRPYIWADTFDWLYSYTTPNNNGDLGVVAVFGGGEHNPSVAVGISNNLSSYKESARFWKMVPIICGKQSPDEKNEKWGDYLRLRPYGNDSWIGTGFTLGGSINDKDVHPAIFSFDKSILDNFGNPDYLKKCKNK